MFIRKSRKSRKGFSLLELLAVVVILGIIAAIVIPRVTDSSTKAKTEANRHNVATLNAAVERFYVDNGTWPATLGAMGINYLPDGVPAAPIGGAYSIDATTHRVIQP